MNSLLSTIDLEQLTQEHANQQGASFLRLLPRTPEPTQDNPVLADLERLGSLDITGLHEVLRPFQATLFDTNHLVSAGYPRREQRCSLSNEIGLRTYLDAPAPLPRPADALP